MGIIDEENHMLTEGWPGWVHGRPIWPTDYNITNCSLIIQNGGPNDHNYL